jgi:hypothetical protein
LGFFKLALPEKGLGEDLFYPGEQLTGRFFLIELSDPDGIVRALFFNPQGFQLRRFDPPPYGLTLVRGIFYFLIKSDLDAINPGPGNRSRKNHQGRPEPNKHPLQQFTSMVKKTGGKFPILRGFIQVSTSKVG